ncbi:MAG: hypothetical protein E3J72_22730 [Planctomycetota bacterium]|nr:MAG: hypothetical protein E3J72_22730 [Planctomycetota bacterium]
MKAEEFVSVGYQKLLTFERPGGGFDWWGREPALVFLTAYGLQQFVDMKKVYPTVDEGVIKRARGFLAGKQDADGAWRKVGGTHGMRMSQFKNPVLPLTAYVAWSLLESGETGDAVKKAITYIKNHLDDAGGEFYVMALAANALIAYDPEDTDGLAVLRMLDSKKQSEDSTFFWKNKGKTMYHSSGKAGDVETTALVAYAMLKAGVFAPTINGALSYIIKSKRGSGGWGSTQATILALKALVRGLGGVEQKEPIEVTYDINGKKKSFTITPDQADVMQLFDLKDFTRTGKNTVKLSAKGKSNLMYQIVGRHYQPWSGVKPPTRKIIDIDLAYDRTNLKKHDLLTANVRFCYNGAAETNMVILDLGVPPGFTVSPGDLAEFVGKKYERYSVSARKITIYIGRTVPGKELKFSYTLIAKYPIKAKTPKSTAYEYYNPDVRSTVKPVELIVTE